VDVARQIDQQYHDDDYHDDDFYHRQQMRRLLSYLAVMMLTEHLHQPILPQWP
jgi:hypothetical protein